MTPMSFCTICGYHLGSSSRFCTRCGGPRPTDQAEPPAVRQPAAEPAHQPRPRPLPGGRAAAAIAAVMVMGLSVLLTWRLTDHRAGPPPVAAGSPRPSAGTGNDTTSPGALPASPVAPSLPPAASDGAIPASPSTARQTSAGQVAAFLGTYFAAINHRDYQAYTSLFDGPARPFRNEQQFLSGYRTTTDSDPVLAALTPTPAGEWAATVTFTSHQSPADSATHSSCTSWDITLYLEPRGNSYLIELPPAGYQPSRMAC